MPHSILHAELLSLPGLCSCGTLGLHATLVILVVDSVHNRFENGASRELERALNLVDTKEGEHGLAVKEAKNLRHKLLSEARRKDRTYS